MTLAEGQVGTGAVKTLAVTHSRRSTALRRRLLWLSVFPDVQPPRSTASGRVPAARVE
ncbi:hypothetical protein [Streptomyces sp. NPDC047803]|uniref:hypothetical protein n=1 Tax=Streptomyces TaxID=1883 RepID=UPI0033F372E5